MSKKKKLIEENFPITGDVNCLLHKGFTLITPKQVTYIKNFKKLLLRELGLRVRCFTLRGGYVRIERTFNDIR